MTTTSPWKYMSTSVTRWLTNRLWHPMFIQGADYLRLTAFDPIEGVGVFVEVPFKPGDMRNAVIYAIESLDVLLSEETEA